MGKNSKKDFTNDDIIPNIEDITKADNDLEIAKEEIILTNHKLEFTLLACNPSLCDSVRIKNDGHRYLILPLFDHKRGLHLLNIEGPNLADCFINKFFE